MLQRKAIGNNGRSPQAMKKLYKNMKTKKEECHTIKPLIPE